MIVIYSIIHFYIITFWKVKKENLLRFIYFLLITWFHRLQVFEQLIRSFNIVMFSKICSKISVKIISMLQKRNKISFVEQIIKKCASITIYLTSCEHFITAIGAFGIMVLVLLTSVHMKLHFTNTAFQKGKENF